MSKSRLTKALFALGIMLLALNVPGLFTSLRNPDIYNEAGTLFLRDITLTEKRLHELLDASPVEGEGRRIAVLGDMLELGSHAEKLHAGLAEIITATSTDLLLLAGPEMKALADRIGAERRTEYRLDAEALKPLLLETVQPGDTVMIKSSKGIGFSKLVDALIKQFPAGAAERASA